MEKLFLWNTQNRHRDAFERAVAESGAPLVAGEAGSGTQSDEHFGVYEVDPIPRDILLRKISSQQKISSQGIAFDGPTRDLSAFWACFNRMMAEDASRAEADAMKDAWQTK